MGSRFPVLIAYANALNGTGIDAAVLLAIAGVTIPFLPRRADGQSGPILSVRNNSRIEREIHSNPERMAQSQKQVKTLRSGKPPYAFRIAMSELH
jgi:hypothetical protein